jgi:hypothetical protein
MVAQGFKNREIATALGIGVHVVRNYLSTVYDKVGVSNRVELALWYEARRHGLHPPSGLPWLPSARRLQLGAWRIKHSPFQRGTKLKFTHARSKETLKTESSSFWRRGCWMQSGSSNSRRRSPAPAKSHSQRILIDQPFWFRADAEACPFTARQNRPQSLGSPRKKERPSPAGTRGRPLPDLRSDGQVRGSLHITGALHARKALEAAKHFIGRVALTPAEDVELQEKMAMLERG